jgi:hypothetical protein
MQAKNCNVLYARSRSDRVLVLIRDRAPGATRPFSQCPKRATHVSMLYDATIDQRLQISPAYHGTTGQGQHASRRYKRPERVQALRLAYSTERVSPGLKFMRHSDLRHSSLPQICDIRLSETCRHFPCSPYSIWLLTSSSLARLGSGKAPS